MKLTKDQQIKSVVVGVALGVLSQDVKAVTSNKPLLEFAFNHAWRKWPGAPNFPSFSGHDPGNLFWIGLSKSSRRSGVCAAWAIDGWSFPYITFEGWSIDLALEHHADGDVTVDDWVELGRLFVEYFDSDHLQR